MNGLPSINQVLAWVNQWLPDNASVAEAEQAMRVATGMFKSIFASQHLSAGGPVKEAHHFSTVIKLQNPIIEISQSKPVKVFHYNQLTQTVEHEWSFFHAGFFTPKNRWPKRYFHPVIAFPNISAFDLVLEISATGVFAVVPEDVLEAYYMLCAYNVLSSRLLFSHEGRAMTVKQGTVTITGEMSPLSHAQMLETRAMSILAKYKSLV